MRNGSKEPRANLNRQILKVEESYTAMNAHLLTKQ